MCGSTGVMVSNDIAICPPSRSVAIGALPLYGTCTSCVPVACWNCVPTRCCTVPLPFEPQASLPGSFLASAARSATVLAGVLALITRTLGTIAIVVTGAKSFLTSYGSFG